MELIYCQNWFVPNDPINNIPALVQVVAWRPPGDKPSSEPMVVGLLMHTCVTRPQRVNALGLRQDGCYFADIIAQHTFFAENGNIVI